ncbi:MAG: flavin reductase family protein [Candidatus Kaelpia aquatica]|nr:flavin reductase family protein [Candidatus Kaelpia aquatica]
MIKREIPLDYARRLLNHGCVILVTSHFRNINNIVTLSWQMPLSSKPRLFALSISRKHFSNKLIRKSRELTINIPGRNLIREVHFCGSCSGKRVNKFDKARLHPVAANFIAAPLIEECFANIECKVRNMYNIGDHTLFVAEALRAIADPSWFDGKFLQCNDKGVQTLHHLGENRYMVSGEVIKAR